MSSTFLDSVDESSDDDDEAPDDGKDGDESLAAFNFDSAVAGFFSLPR